ncbi:MAG: imidazoleglycerol-phosphate dehydratase HisB [Deltaproteobacteria bacterium]|nr:imidazoleglycerol-phosphate dehydratase HisB [Deltaproteobacteria bacterium]
MPRKATITCKTKETDVTVSLNLDGAGMGEIETPIPFFSHMLTNFARHGLFDLKISAKGDIEVDLHHTVEDVGLRLGAAFKEALGDAAGIRRCASSTVPMMDALASVVVDISNRPYLRFDASGAASAEKKIRSVKAGNIDEAFDLDLTKEFLKALSNSAGLDLHAALHYGEDIHHSIEAVFKALGRALSAACVKDARIQGVLSTKGKL